MVRPHAFWFVCCAALISILLPSVASADRVLVASNAIYEVDTGSSSVREVAKLGLFVKDMVVDAAGTSCFVATSDGILEVDLASGETTRVFGDGSARSVELDATSERVYGLFTHGLGELPDLRVFSREDGSVLRSSPLPASTTTLGWNATTGSVIGLEHAVRSVHVYDASTSEGRSDIALPARVGKPGTGTLSPETLVHAASGMMVVPELGEEAGLWIIRSGSDAEWLALGHEAHFRGGAFTADGRSVFTDALTHVATVDLLEGREVKWVALDAIHQRIAVSADGSSLFLTVPVDGKEGALSVLSAETLKPIQRIPVPNASPFAMAVVPN